MFDKLLIANRGEIACRIIKTARRMGIATVAVCSDADAGSMHVEMADEAFHLGGARAQDSYLNVERLIDAVRATGADAVHPGYGFLSENADFADACAEAGAVFVGPPPAAIRAMGSKSEAKRLMEAAGVPLLPGYHEADQSDDALVAATAAIGYPVMVKAAAGGGGRGMRMIESADALIEGLAGARREAKAGFGDDTLLIEKFLARPRHVEMQVFADSQGDVVHLFERDCSIQRRHQKVVEEAPAPGMTASMRENMASAAIAAAKAIGYVGAGTVEFLVEADRMGEPDCFYFMEMNTRLQVEHPVTEMITGTDLVEWQLRVADGEPLPLSQEKIVIAGHAIEVRLYAEDAARGFRPSPGPLLHVRTPEEDTHVRFDTGVREGDVVTANYDPMIAKIVCWDADRATAIGRLCRALAATHIVGTATNLDFLSAVIGSDAFADEELDTGFIERHESLLLPEPNIATDETVAAVALADLLWRRAEAEGATLRSGDPYSPWHETDGWRLNDRSYIELRYRDCDIGHCVRAQRESEGYLFEVNDRRITTRGHFREDGKLSADIDGHRIIVSVVPHAGERHVLTEQGTRLLEFVDPFATRAGVAVKSGQLSSPLPGRVVSVSVSVGDSVKAGQTLMVVEAMKMEHAISAPADGKIDAIHFTEGDQVAEGIELISLSIGSD